MLFHAIVDGDVALFDSIVGPDSVDKADLVSMAAAIKRDFERAARDKKAEADNCKRDAEAKREAAGGVSPNATADADALQETLELAISNRAEVVERRNVGLTLLEDAEEARQLLDDASTDSESIDVLREEADRLSVKFEDCGAEVERLTNELRVATGRLNDTKSVRDAAFDRLKAAERHAETCEAWNATIAKAEAFDVPTIRGRRERRGGCPGGKGGSRARR